MKRLFLLLGCIMMVSISSYAQYRVNKKIYDYHTYSYQKGDPYKPTTAGFASVFIPGLGQMISGEPARGLCFLGGYCGSIGLCLSGFSVFLFEFAKDERHPINYGRGISGLVIGAIGAGCSLGVFIWSVSDAEHVAKVNNLAYRDKNLRGYNISLSPYLGSVTGEKFPLGLSCKIRF
jgi:hypothetical protein